MKQYTTIKDDKWVWPISDEASYAAQIEQNGLIHNLLPHVENKKIAIQAGGNCGIVPSAFSEHFDAVYTFEPDPINFYCLVQNASNENVIKIQGCLGNDKTTVNVQQLLRANLPHDIGGVHVNGLGFTPVFRIDDLNLPYCDLIQLDVEGYELNALLGAVETIEKYKPLVCVEVYGEWLGRYNNTENDVIEFLYNHGYKHIMHYHADKIFKYSK
jgi:FkbM family methyltransferase